MREWGECMILTQSERAIIDQKTPIFFLLAFRKKNRNSKLE